MWSGAEYMWNYIDPLEKGVAAAFLFVRTPNPDKLDSVT